MVLGIKKASRFICDWRHADMRLCGSLQIRVDNDCFGRSDVPAACGWAAILLRPLLVGGNNCLLLTVKLVFAKLFEDRNIVRGSFLNDISAHAAVAVSDKVSQALDRLLLNTVGRSLPELLG